MCPERDKLLIDISPNIMYILIHEDLKEETHPGLY